MNKSNGSTPDRTMEPFILEFGEVLPDLRGLPVRYDWARAVSQVFVNGDWIDAVDSVAPLGGVTRMTKVSQETTDDE